MQVRDDRADGAARQSGNVQRPQLDRQILDKKDRHAVIRMPRIDQRPAAFVSFCRAFLLYNLRLITRVAERRVGLRNTPLPHLPYPAIIAWPNDIQCKRA